MQFSAKILLNNRFSPSPQGAGIPTDLRNPESATDVLLYLFLIHVNVSNMTTYFRFALGNFGNRIIDNLLSHMLHQQSSNTLVMVIVFGNLLHEDEIIAFDVSVSSICLIGETGYMTVLLIEFFSQT